MNNKALNFLVCIVLIFTFIPTKIVFAYADLTEYNNYINELDITYKDLNLTPEELAVIENLQENGGITYGMHTNDYSIPMIFQQISKVFDIDITPVVYDDYAELLSDVAEGKVDFTGSMVPTEERLELFDFTTSTHKDKTFLYIKHSDFDLISSSETPIDRVIRVGYPTGFALDGLLSANFKETFNYELIPISTADKAVELINKGELDMVYGDISWYGDLIAIENFMAIDYTHYIDTYFSGNVTKKGTNQEFVSAINKMYAETNVLLELQNQIDDYYQNAALYALKDKYYDFINHDTVNTIYISEYRPYVYEEDGVYTGLFIDLLSEIFNSFDINYEFVLTSDINTNYLSGNEFTVAMPVFITDETKEIYNLTIPVATSNMTVITIPDSSSKYFTHVDDLSIQKVGALNFGYMHDYIDDIFLNSANVVYYDDLESLTTAINSGDIKFGIVPYEEYNKFAIENKLLHIKVLNALTLPQYSIAFATPKTDRGLKYEAILSSAISIINYSDLRNKYLSTTPEIEAVYQYKSEMYYSRLHMIVFSAVFTIIFLIALIYINQKRANTDYLTKLRNRRTSGDYVKLMKKKKNTAVAYIDLDNFKIINDVYGHHYGDKVLIYVASELLKLSKHSRAFRVGGDEFVIVYNNKHINFNKDIKTILDRTIKIEQNDIKVEGSVGNLNIENYSYLSVEDIINLSDYAMMTAKRRGKNIVIEIDDKLVQEYITIRDLRVALENEQYNDTVKFYLESIKNENKLYGFCLIAKCHYNNHFIDYDEIRSHMTNKLVLNKIGLIMFEKLCQSITYMNKHSEVKMRYIYELEEESMNNQNIQALALILEKYNIPPRDITLRVDPKLFTGSKGFNYVTLLKQLGCKISIDYYKISGESLLYLNSLDFSVVELDLSRLIEFLKNKQSTDFSEIVTELTANASIKKLIELCKLLKSDLILYASDDIYVQLIMDFFLVQLKTKIFYIEKDSVILLDDYLNSFDK